MSNKRTTIASILLFILIITIIGIGIGSGIPSINKLAFAELQFNAKSNLEHAPELRGLTVRGGALLHETHLKELAAAKHQVLQLDVHNLL